MAYYKLVRQEPQGKEVRGILSEAVPYGTDIEYIPVADTLENLDYLILPLVYRIQVTMSPKYKQLMPLITGVPGRSGIRIHCGTKPSHSQGCVLTTRRTQYKALLLKLLEQQKRNEPIYLEVI